ncbi:unnamed protein product, partial [marine sediment metagenome]
DCDGSKFYILSFLEGNGQIFYGNESDINLNTKTLDIKKGETILLPALLGKTTIKTDSKLRENELRDNRLKNNKLRSNKIRENKLKFLKFYIPDITKDIIKPLINKGFTKQDIISLGGWNKVNDVMKYF